jgi:hypothetical protein
MSRAWTELTDYLIGPFLRENLRINDTFHLISFSDRPRLEIIRPVEGLGDVEAIITRILLLYPLDPPADISGILSFAENYTAAFPLWSQARVILISGSHPNDIKNYLSRFKNRGIDFVPLRMPFETQPPLLADPGDLAVIPSQALGDPAVIFPAGDSDEKPKTQFEANPPEAGAQTSPATVRPPPAEASERETPPPLSMNPPRFLMPGPFPAEQIQTLDRPKSQTAGNVSPLFFIIPGIISIFILVFFLFRLPGRQRFVIGAREEKNQPPRVSLFVKDQSTAGGKRNVHRLIPGHVLTLGGGTSDFLIFLAPIPPKIAEIRYDGHDCSLVPLKRKYFPDLNSKTVPNCVGKTIRVVSDRGYALEIRLEWYEDPLIPLNRLLRSIQAPG